MDKILLNLLSTNYHDFPIWHKRPTNTLSNHIDSFVIIIRETLLTNIKPQTTNNSKN
jgi:hypothetical protein